MSKKLSIADARCDSYIGSAATIQGWVRTRRDSKGRFQFLGNQRWIMPRQFTSHRGCPIAQLRERSETSRGWMQRNGRGRNKEIGWPRPSDGAASTAFDSPRLGRSRNVSLAKETAHAGKIARVGPFASAHEHVWRDRPNSQLDQL